MKINKIKLNSSGQVAVEYVLLLAVGIAIYLALVSGLMSRSPQSPGLIIKKWTDIIRFIGQDQIEK